MNVSLSAGDNRSSMNWQTSRRCAARGSESVKPLIAIMFSAAKWPRRRGLGASAADVGNRRRMEVAAEKVRRRRAQRRDRGKAVDDRHVREDAAHAIAAAFAVQLVQRAREAPSVLGLVPGAHQASPDLGRGELDRVGTQRIASEEVDLLQLREQTGTRVAAGRALHLRDRKELARGDLIRIEFGAAVEMARDDEEIAAHALPAGRCEPIGTTAFHQLDELVLVRGQTLPEHFLFVGGIDGDRAHRALAGVTVRTVARGEQRCNKEEAGRQTHR